MVIVFIMFAFLYGFDSNQKKQLEITKLDKTIALSNVNDSLDNKLNYSIDLMQIKDNILSIDGWSIVKGISSIDVIPIVILKDEVNNIYKGKTRISQRDDVTKYINDGENYKNSGFIAQFNTDGLEKGKNYSVGIQIQINKNIYFIWSDRKIVL